MALPKRPFPRPPQPTQDPPPERALPLQNVRPVPTVAPVPSVATTSQGSPEAAAAAKKTAAEYVARRAAAEAQAERDKLLQEDDERDERSSDVRLKAFAEKIAERYKIISEIFAGTPYDPTLNGDFKSFLAGQVAETAMRYVRVGIVSSADADAVTPDERARKLREKGFSIGEAAKGAANEKTDAPEGSTDTEKAAEAASPPSAGDQAFMESPAFQEALRMGLDLNEDD